MRKLTLIAAALLAASAAQAEANLVTQHFFQPVAATPDGRTTAGLDLNTGLFGVWIPATNTRISLTGDTNGATVGISNDGNRVVGGLAVASDGNRSHPAYYSVSTGQWTVMPTGLGGASSTSIGTANTISGDGRILGGASFYPGAGTSQTAQRATLWNTETGTALNLGTTTTAEFSTVLALSDDGRVAGGRVGNNGVTLWTDFDADGAYTRTDLGSIGLLNAISGDGRYAVGGTVSAYRYNTLTQQLDLLPKLSPTDANMRDVAMDITADGKTIVGYETNFTTGAKIGFIWRDGIGTQSLDSYLAANGVDIADTFTFRVASSISADGSVINGFGTLSGVSGDTAFSATLAVPEPASCALMLAGLGAVGLLARRRHGCHPTAR